MSRRRTPLTNRCKRPETRVTAHCTRWPASETSPSHAGVSLATASRVASGSDAVRAETRERVERAMRELLYVPPGARTRRARSACSCPSSTNPIFPALAQAMERTRRRRRARHDPLQHRRLRVPRGRLRAHAARAPRRRDDLHLERDDRPALATTATTRRLLDEGARIVFVNGGVGAARRHRRSASTSAPRAGSRPSTCSSSATADRLRRRRRALPARRARRPRAASPRCAPPGSSPTASSCTASSASRAAGSAFRAPGRRRRRPARPGSSARAT